jgi:hypothetical protein
LTGQNRTGQDRTGQDRTGQDRTGHDPTEWLTRGGGAGVRNEASELRGVKDRKRETCHAGGGERLMKVKACDGAVNKKNWGLKKVREAFKVLRKGDYRLTTWKNCAVEDGR